MAFNPSAFDPSSVDIDAQLLDLDRSDCEESLYLFLKSAWKYIDPAQWKDGWAVDAICEHLQAVVDGQIQKLIINCPPRIGKSDTVAIAFPAWVWAQPINGPISGPGVPMLFASYADKLSLRDSVKCRRLIESPWYQARWGHRFQLTSDQNTKSRFSNDKGGERLITSIGAGVTGEGANCFAAGTLVSTPTGTVPIEALVPGEHVLSFDVSRGKVVKSRVIASSKRTAHATCTVREVSGHRFVCTPDHPIFSPGRGFIRAGEMGSGDRVLVSDDPQEQTSPDTPASDLRQLRSASEEAVVRSAQSAEAGQQGLLLQHQMPWRAPFIQEFSGLRVVRRVCGAARAILREAQASARKLVHQGAAYLRDMRSGISALWARQEILLDGMCGRRAFSADDRRGQSKIQIARDGALFKSFQEHEKNYCGARRPLLHELRRTGEKNQNALSGEDLIAGPPYRREHSEQRSDESDNALRQLSQDSPYYRISHIAEVVTDREAEVCVYDIQVEGTSCFFAEGILVHNCIIIDDPNAANDVASEASMQEVIDWWQTTMPTRINDLSTGAWIIIQQRLAEDDLTGHILEHESEGWTHLCLPGRYEPERSFHTVIGWKDPRTEPGQLLWPERFSEAALKGLERTMGPYIFAGQIQQRPEPKGGGIIKREWWKLWDRESWPPMDFVLACLDTAYTEDRMNDPSGMIIWGIFNGDVNAHATRIVGPDGEIIRPSRTYSEFAPQVMCMYAWDDHLELHELVEKVGSTCVKMKVDTLMIENKASGISVAQEVRRLFSREKFGVELFDPKSQDKAARLYSVQHLFAEGIIHGPDRPWMEKVIKQVGQFPKGAHDEYVDLTSMGLRKLRDMGLLIRQPEREAEIEQERAYTGRQQPLYAV